MIVHLSELIPFLEQIDASPRKGLSQNFLIDENIVRKIITTANVQENDHILEIGPGPGALTEQLALSKACVIAIEKDRRFASALTRFGSIQVVEADFLSIPLQQYKDFAPIKIVANLPYYIATPILEKICRHHSIFSSAFIMVQKEMAERMVAEPNTKEISSFTIFLQTYCKPKIAMKVSRHCFYPEPNVDSCVVELQFHEPPMKKPESFSSFVRKAYQQRRKMLRSSIQLQIEPYASMRPEALSLDEWIAIFNETSGQSGPSK